MKSLYVGNLAYGTTVADLRAAFSPFGKLGSVRIASDRAGRSKGFAFVEMADESAALAASRASGCPRASIPVSRSTPH
jgi:RNA recognition motif-containing protein